MAPWLTGVTTSVCLPPSGVVNATRVFFPEMLLKSAPISVSGVISTELTAVTSEPGTIAEAALSNGPSVITSSTLSPSPVYAMS